MPSQHHSVYCNVPALSGITGGTEHRVLCPVSHFNYSLFVFIARFLNAAEDRQTLCPELTFSPAHADTSSRCDVLSLHVHIAAGMYQGLMFPEVWSSFHGHVGNQVTTRALPLHSAITSQFVIPFNIIGQKWHG